MPNGIIAHIFGPVGKFVNVITQFSYKVNIYATNPNLGIFNFTEGKKHDAGMLADSNFLHQLEENAFSSDGNPMCVCGDSAYPHRVHLQAPFRNGEITERMKEFNTQMTAVRVSIKWLFGDVINTFRFMDFGYSIFVLGTQQVRCFLYVSSSV